MSETAAARVNRIVQLVAELSREAGTPEEGVPLAAVAERLGVTARQVQQDLRTLTAISDDAEAEWLQSLSVWQESDRIAVVSRGAYRRPMRFTPEELLAIRVALAMEGVPGADLARRIGAALRADESEPRVAVAAGRGGAGGWEAEVVAMGRSAAEQRRVLTILYTGERDLAGSPRTVEPHQVVAAWGRYYVVAWCRRAGGWRHFRADRVLDAMVEEGRFVPRADFAPVDSLDDVFRADLDQADEVVVRYSAAVARWLAEGYPDARPLPDGSLEVTHRVVEPVWLVRTVLAYADEAEVVSPAAYRSAMRKATGWAI